MAYSSSLEVSDIFKCIDEAELLSDIWVEEGSSNDFGVPIRKRRLVRGWTPMPADPVRALPYSTFIFLRSFKNEPP